MADNTVTFRTNLDNSQLEKEYAKTVKKIEGMERDISAKKARKAVHEQDSLALSGQLDAAKAKLHEMQSAAANVFSPGMITSQEQKVNNLQARWDEAQDLVEKYDKQIADATEKLETQKAKAAELTDAINQSSDSAKGLDLSFEGVSDRIEKVSKRLSKLATRVLIFSAITSVLRSFRDYMGDVIAVNDEASSALARLKGALLTMIQPLVSVVIPAFTTFMNILTAIIGKIASFVAMFGGTTAKEAASAAKALNAETKALDGTGAAAKKAAKSLMGFDEINRLGDTDTGTSTAGATSSTDPDFSWSDGVTEDLERIADLILLIGAGLALWKIGSKLPGMLGTVATTLGGILITIGGLLLMWDGLTDAWESGVDWGNLLESILGLVAAAGGLYIAFGSVAAGIMLVVGGIALLVTGFHDAMEHGWNLQNTLMAIAGIVATGLGITLLTGSLIPALVGGIAGLLIALTVATGNGEELISGIRDVCKGFVDFFTGIFSGDIEKALGGIEAMFDGLGQVVGSVFKGARDSILSFLDWLDEKTGGKLHGVIEAAKEMVTMFFDTTLETGAGWLEGIKQLFSGLIEFIAGVFTGDWEQVWEGFKDIFKGILNSLISIMEGFVNLIISGINWVLKQINKISFTIPSWVPGIGGSYFGPNISLLGKYEVPRLAQGAVIPPNREFLAVLGDQKHGTNIEAPLETIQEAVALVMDDMTGGMMAGFEATVEVLREILEAIYGIEIGDEVIGRAVDRYTRRMALRNGG